MVGGKWLLQEGSKEVDEEEKNGDRCGGRRRVRSDASANKLAPTAKKGDGCDGGGVGDSSCADGSAVRSASHAASHPHERRPLVQCFGEARMWGAYDLTRRSCTNNVGDPGVSGPHEIQPHGGSIEPWAAEAE